MKTKFKKDRKNVEVPLSEVIGNFKNPRKGTYNKDRLEQLKESLDNIGQLNPIKIDEYGVLLAGHRRTEAARQLGWVTIRADIKTNLSDFDKSALLISDNATQERFDAWENRKAIADIYWNEFCAVYQFKNGHDKGYKAFSQKLGISISMVRKCIESMAKNNLNLAKELKTRGCAPSVMDEVLQTPTKYKDDVIKKATELSIKMKPKNNISSGKALNGVDSNRIVEKIRNYKRKLRVDDAKENLHPSFVKLILRRFDDMGLLLDKKLINKAEAGDIIDMKKAIEKNILPFYKLCKKGKPKISMKDSQKIYLG